ncbi:hypothetical protein F4859DRAFT_478455, partial [Xylaria cf. heliscus]
MLPDNNTGIDPAYQHFLAMETLRVVKTHLESAPVAPTPIERVEFTHTLPDLPGEAFFAWTVFFNDLYGIRHYLRSFWRNYHQSLDTLATVTLVTNTAIRMIRKTCLLMIRTTERLPDMPQEYNITEWIFRAVTAHFLPRGHFCFNKWQSFEANWCCYEAMSALQDYLPYLKGRALSCNGAVPVDDTEWRNFETHFGAWDPSGPNREFLVGKYIQLLCICMHNLRIFRRKGNENEDPTFLPCYDEITNGWV